jgi:uncharacterized protein
MLKIIATETGISQIQLKRTADLLDEGNTVPFIARYRKEMTGTLDENQIRLIQERLSYLRNLEERKLEVTKTIEEQGKLSPELQNAITQATKLQEVEDLYRPYKQKRRTRASMARDKGLEPLAFYLLQLPTTGNPVQEAQQYVDPDKQVTTAEEALTGAMDICAEMVADDTAVRKWVRHETWQRGMLITEKKAEESSDKHVYEMYYAFSEAVKHIVPHRILALNRGEAEGILRVKIDIDASPILTYLQRTYIPKSTVAAPYLQAMLEDSYKRLLAPAVERDLRNELTEIAEEQAIRIFSENLRPLLLQAPVKAKTVLGLDPAYRTGCKWAVVDETGKLLRVGVIYPTAPHHKVAEAKATLREVIAHDQVDLIAIGNGTASRETEEFVAQLLGELDQELFYLLVNEAGASVYSASKLAGAEFPTLDVAERSAVSIARRLQDPLAELVKIDPQSIGVGQYQHDVSQTKLADNLKFVVESAVNFVGVDVNTASPALLEYVSGVSKQVAKNIVDLREELGKFQARTQLKKVPRLGDKTYEQCIGFLRVTDGKNPLDNTPIHPESYPKVEILLQQLQLTPAQVGTELLRARLRDIRIAEMAAQLDIGVPTLQDIVDSLLRPGRDPRDELAKPLLRKDVLTLTDLQIGMELQGTVRNVVDFGAFVDVGLKNDGLVHISRMSDHFVKHPLDVVAVGQIVTVWVAEVDDKKMRVGLSMLPV